MIAMFPKRCSCASTRRPWPMARSSGRAVATLPTSTPSPQSGRRAASRPFPGRRLPVGQLLGKQPPGRDHRTSSGIQPAQRPALGATQARPGRALRPDPRPELSPWPPASRYGCRPLAPGNQPALTGRGPSALVPCQIGSSCRGGSVPTTGRSSPILNGPIYLLVPPHHNDQQGFGVQSRSRRSLAS